MSAVRVWPARGPTLKVGGGGWVAVESGPRRSMPGSYFIGEIGTPWKAHADCPKNPGESDAICTIRLDPR